jgi:hypothetical protein
VIQTENKGQPYGAFVGAAGVALVGAAGGGVVEESPQPDKMALKVRPNNTIKDNFFFIVAAAFT